MKKTIKTIGIIVMLAVLSTVAFAQQYEAERNFTVYRTDDGRGVSIRSYTGTNRSLNIPPTIGGLPVVGFWEGAFEGKNFTSVTIPASVTGIGYWAFSNCAGLTSITIPASVTAIGGAAFRGCTSLRTIDFQGAVLHINPDAFEDTPWYNSQPNGLVYAGKVLFTWKGTMRANTVINNIRTDTVAINVGAFQDFPNLTGVTIPGSVKIIGSSAFNGTGLKSVTIPASVTAIEKYLFWNCESLASVTLPGSVKIIDDYAFAGCTSLKSITIPASVTAIGESAFNGCTSLSDVTIPGGVTSIGAQAFGFCGSLTSVTFAAGSKIARANFGNNAFPPDRNGSNSGSDTLKTAYLSGGAGRYNSTNDGSTWKK